MGIHNIIILNYLCVKAFLNLENHVLIDESLPVDYSQPEGRGWLRGAGWSAR